MPSPPVLTAWPREVRNLFDAKREIKKLRAQLANGKPIPKRDPEPVPTINPPQPDPGMPPNPPTRDAPPLRTEFTLDLSNLAPAAFERFIGERTNLELIGLLAAENGKTSKLKDDHLVGQLHREIKRRQK